MFLPVCLNYTKHMLHRPTKTRREIKGNVILMIESETIKAFQIPTFNDKSFLTAQEKKNYSYTLKDGKIVNVRRTQYTGHLNKVSRQTARIYLQSPSKHPRTRNYGIAFPYYFNKSMILTAIVSIAKNKEFPIYCRVNNGKLIELFGDELEYDNSWGKAKVVTVFGATKNLNEVQWGNPTLVMPLVNKR